VRLCARGLRCHHQAAVHALPHFFTKRSWPRLEDHTITQLGNPRPLYQRILLYPCQGDNAQKKRQFGLNRSVDDGLRRPARPTWLAPSRSSSPSSLLGLQMSAKNETVRIGAVSGLDAGQLSPPTAPASQPTASVVLISESLLGFGRTRTYRRSSCPLATFMHRRMPSPTGDWAAPVSSGPSCGAESPPRP